MGLVSTSRPRSPALMAVCSMSIALGSDASVFDLDGPLPEIPESNASKSGRERVIERARRDNLTVRQLAQIASSYGGLALVGTPKMIADQMEEWLYTAACDGFNIMFPWVPGGLDDFVDRVVPNYSAATSSATNTKAGPCAKTSASPAPRTAFSRSGASNLEHRRALENINV
jgi:alkanesulfonate monooxygenase SsuD/methylene tetrahydromethanopterin reductase-like flavin-dependent oxidoreductase (luciferase family)